MVMERERNNAENPRSPRENHQARPHMPVNYWNRIADDAAHGYGADKNRKRSTSTRLNEDQLPGDNERG
jgi:hypothetical protein